MVRHTSTDVVTVAVPFTIFTGAIQDVGNVAAKNLVPLSASIPKAQVAKSDYHAVHLLVKVEAFIVQPAVDLLAPFLVTDHVTVIFQLLPLEILVILPCLVVYPTVI